MSYWLTLPLTNNFSGACNVVWQHFTHSRMSFKIGVNPLKSVPFLSTNKWSESCSVMSHSLQSHGLYSPWNSPGQNTEVGSFSLLPGIFPTQGSNPCLPHCRRILCQLINKGSPPYQLNLGTILNLLLSFQQSSQHLHKEWILSQEIIYSTSIRSNSSSVSVLLGDCGDSVTSSVSVSNSSSFVIFYSVCSYFLPLKSWATQLSMRVTINFFQTPVNVGILTSSHEPQMLLIASRMVNSFQKVFNLFCQDSSEESLPRAAFAWKKSIS